MISDFLVGLTMVVRGCRKMYLYSYSTDISNTTLLSLSNFIYIYIFVEYKHRYAFDTVFLQFTICRF